MRYVYANSACNIAASAALCPQDGLFCFRDPQDIRPGIIETTLASDLPETYYIFDKSYWDRQLFDGTLHHRGWVFQERFLAPRQLYFTKQQILWECLDDHKCEGFPNGIPLHDSFKSIVPLMKLSRQQKSPEDTQMSDQAISLWIDLVTSYSRCNFTNPSDKLLAFAGVAKLFQEITNDAYVAGLWRSRVLDLLDWCVCEPTAKLSLEYRAPSWSWISIDGPVKPRRPAYRCKFLVELVDVCVNTEGEDATVSVTGGFIKLKGIVIVAACQQTTIHCLEIVTDKLSHPISIQPYLDTTDVKILNGGKICFLLFKTQQIKRKDRTTYDNHIDLICLIVEAVKGSSSTYRRLGHFVLNREENVEIFLSASAEEWENITLI